MGPLQVCKAESYFLPDDLENGSQILDGCQALLAIPGCFLGNEQLLLLCVHACIYVVTVSRVPPVAFRVAAGCTEANPQWLGVWAP